MRPVRLKPGLGLIFGGGTAANKSEGWIFEGTTEDPDFKPKPNKPLQLGTDQTVIYVPPPMIIITTNPLNAIPLMIIKPQEVPKLPRDRLRAYPNSLTHGLL